MLKKAAKTCPFKLPVSKALAEKIKNMHIEYKINSEVTEDQFLKLLKDSALGERRPIEDKSCIKGMLENSNLVVTAWKNNELIGMARSLTDFHYACYISDLAVSKRHQNKGIGKALQKKTQDQLGSKCKIILIASPDANIYYEHIGFKNNKRCWVLERNKNIN